MRNEVLPKKARFRLCENAWFPWQPYMVLKNGDRPTNSTISRVLPIGQISNFEFCCTPQEEKLGYYFQSGTCLGALETHDLFSFLWSMLCKWPVINVTLLT